MHGSLAARSGATRTGRSTGRSTGGFTLVELLITIAIISILASLFLAGLFGVEESARVDKTKGTIAKINNIIMQRWEAYRTRRVPFTTAAASYGGVSTGPNSLMNIVDGAKNWEASEWTSFVVTITSDPVVQPPFPNPPVQTAVGQWAVITGNTFDQLNFNAYNLPAGSPWPSPIAPQSGATYSIRNAAYRITSAAWRLDMLRELQRMEMPDHWTDITSGPIPQNQTTDHRTALTPPSLTQAYFRKFTTLNAANAANPTATYENAECLYLICTTGLGDELDSSELFKASEISDVDGDGAPEFVDAWGTPIIFIRWAPGFTSELQTHLAPDPFDPMRVYPSVVESPIGIHPYPPANVNNTPPGLQIEQTFALYPLVVSAGPDKAFNIFVHDSTLIYALVNNDPYWTISANYGGAAPDGGLSSSTSTAHIDNITNHLMGTK